MTDTSQRVRIDKWLWAARFFKTRALATTAIKNGKVKCAGQRVKASRMLAEGELLEIERGFDRYEVVVEALSDQRGPASLAQTLYTETEDSQKKRQLESDKRRMAALQRPVSTSRPDKKQRRQIVRFNRQSD